MGRTIHLALALLLPLAAMAADLPPDCLYVQDGQVQVQGSLQAPAELLQARNVNMLRPLGRGLMLWTVEQRDDTGNLIQFALHLADLRAGTNQQLLKGLDPFGIGTDWMLQRAALQPSGKALLLRVRLGGTGGFVNVYKLMLDGERYFYAMDEGTVVWDSASADGSVVARPYWELAPDWQTAANEREAKYATIIVAGKNTPQGRKLWEIKHHTDIARWAQPDIDSTAVSPDGRSVAYANPEGLWLAAVSGGEPKLLLPAGEPARYYETPVWHPDGSGIYAIVNGGGLIYVNIAEPGLAQPVAPDVTGLCIPRM